MENSLILRVKQGDDTAFNHLIEQHRQIMFHYAYLVVHDSAVAEDVTQEAVLRIYKHFKKFDTSQPFRPWAISITRNIARNHNRAWGRYKHMIVRFLNSREHNPIHPEQVTQKQQDAQHVYDAVCQLSQDFQDVIFCRYFMGLSVDESAIALDTTAGTVKSRSHRALKQLRRLIERDYAHLVEDLQNG